MGGSQCLDPAVVSITVQRFNYVAFRCVFMEQPDVDMHALTDPAFVLNLVLALGEGLQWRTKLAQCYVPLKLAIRYRLIYLDV